MDLTYGELKEKEVVNITDGKKLGKVIDIVMTDKGQVIGVITPGDRKLFKNGMDNVFVPWCNLIRIGSDVILIELGGHLPYSP